MFLSGELPCFLDFKPIVLAALSFADGMGMPRKDLASAKAVERERECELPVVEAAEIATANLQRISAPLRAVRLIAPKGSLIPDSLAPNAEKVNYRRQILLFRMRGDREVSALRTQEGDERAALTTLSQRDGVEFATLDKIQTRQFIPTDSNLSFQWHHRSVDSFGAWEKGLGDHTVAVAIVDTPFQMNHPDLLENTEAGWDVVDELPILTSAGDAHSTAAAGMTAAVINNNVGVAGAANCRIVPIGITGATSEMYQAVLWAADHNIRVVNISWTGADEPVL